MSNQEYFIHDFNNFSNRTDLKLFLYCDDLCDIRIKEHTKTEIFVKIK